jgi:hypothetical protein
MLRGGGVNMKSVLSKFPANSLMIPRTGNLNSLLCCKKFPERIAKTEGCRGSRPIEYEKFPVLREFRRAPPRLPVGRSAARLALGRAGPIVLA